MKSVVALSALSMLAGAEAAETVLGAYIFHRHGDRTPKALAPTNLTALGYEQVYTSGQYYRSRYLSGDAKIRGINEDQVKLSQLQVQSPVDNVLQTSAMGFLQGLYPPVQTVQTLASGRDVQAPMDGYQLIPINTVQTGSGSEDAGWLQDASSCQNAKISSNSYFDSEDYKKLEASTKDFYASLVPSINNVIPDDKVSFKNAYVVFDILNVAEIHNSTIPNPDALSNSTLTQLRTLADAHEWGLAYNATDNMRAVAGMQLAGEILTHMNSMISSQGTQKLGIQFGAYATFLSLFGLTGLNERNADFTAVVDYASSMVFELFTTVDVSSGFPAEQDLQVRFLFHNGTASNTSQPAVYPLFGTEENALSWTAFQEKIAEFAIADTQAWCKKCGNENGVCAAYAPDAKVQQDRGKTSGGGAVSPVVGGVIGAFVTLAVVLGVAALGMLGGGFTLVRKRGVVTSVETKVEPKV